MENDERKFYVEEGKGGKIGVCTGGAISGIFKIEVKDS